MTFWIRCTDSDSAKALLALIVSGSFNGGSHPHCRLSLANDFSVDAELDNDEVLAIGEQPQVREIGPLPTNTVLPDLWQHRDEMVRLLLA